MVGTRRECCRLLHQHHTLTNRRQHHRRTADGSGNREGSLQCGTACSAASPALIRPHACWRHRKVKCANGISHSGRMVKVFRHGWQIPRRTQTRWCLSSFACRSRRPWPRIVWRWQSGHIRGRSLSGITPVQGCLASLAWKRIDLLAGPSPSRHHQIQTKEEYCFRPDATSPLPQHWPVILRQTEVGPRGQLDAKR